MLKLLPILKKNRQHTNYDLVNLCSVNTSLALEWTSKWHSRQLHWYIIMWRVATGFPMGFVPLTYEFRDWLIPWGDFPLEFSVNWKNNVLATKLSSFIDFKFPRYLWRKWLSFDFFSTFVSPGYLQLPNSFKIWFNLYRNLLVSKVAYWSIFSKSFFSPLGNFPFFLSLVKPSSAVLDPKRW